MSTAYSYVMMTDIVFYPFIRTGTHAIIMYDHMMSNRTKLFITVHV